jgi:DNA end-binding protein Ku
MAARATWKGFLKVSLVNIPIKVFPATESSATISFNQLHNACQTRIQQKRWCPSCNKEVANTEIVKGYEFEKGRYVIMSEDDIDKVRPSSTRVIDLVQFDDVGALDPMYVDRTYYLAPDGQVAADAFAVMREGMKGKIGVGKLALYGREYLVAVKAHERSLVMYTLHHAAEIRGMEGIEELATIPAKVRPEEVNLARQVIGTFEKKLDLADYRDEYREGLQKIIDAKVAGEEVVAPAAEMPPKVVNLMEALKKSLDSASAAKKPVKAQLPKKTTAARAEPKRKRA